MDRVSSLVKVVGRKRMQLMLLSIIFVSLVMIDLDLGK